MATLPQKDLATFVQDMTTAWAVQMGLSPVFQSGDPLLAIMQGVSIQLLFIQAQVQLVNALARAQTSAGADLDSFYGQFNFIRLPGATPSGQETFSKNTPAVSQILVPAAVLGANGTYTGGTIVQTPGGAIKYQVIPDLTNPNYDTATNSYVLTPPNQTMSVTIAALVAGSSSNVSAGQLSQLASVVPGIDSVTNPSPIANGLAPETDAAFTSRFVLYLASLSKATHSAIVEAIESVQPNILFNLIENVDVSDNPRLGEFVAVIDDGTGAPPSNLVNEVQVAINAVRGFTILAEAKAVTPLIAHISITIRVAAGFVAPSVQAAVQTAVVNLVNSVGIGQTLYISAVEAAALAVDGVTSVRPGTTINSSTSDLAIPEMDAARTAGADVTVSTY